MCGDCNNVVDNTCYGGDTCPSCGSGNWASPIESHGEWDIIRKLQTELLITTGERDHYKIKWDLCDASATLSFSRVEKLQALQTKNYRTIRDLEKELAEINKERK